LTEIASCFGMKHYAGVASAVSALTRQMSIDSSLLSDVNSVVKRFDGMDPLHLIRHRNVPRLER
jgi:hypothetical protein